MVERRRIGVPDSSTLPLGKPPTPGYWPWDTPIRPVIIVVREEPEEQYIAVRLGLIVIIGFCVGWLAAACRSFA